MKHEFHYSDNDPIVRQSSYEAALEAIAIIERNGIQLHPDGNEMIRTVIIAAITAHGSPRQDDDFAKVNSILSGIAVDLQQKRRSPFLRLVLWLGAIVLWWQGVMAIVCEVMGGDSDVN